MGLKEEDLSAIKEAVRELDAIKAQKEEVISTYGKQYAEIDRRVHALEAQKESLEVDVKNLEVKAEEAIKTIRVASLEAEKIVSDAKNEASRVRSSAVIVADGIIADAESIRKDAENARSLANIANSDSNAKLRQASSSFATAKELEKQAQEDATRASELRAEALKLKEEVDAMAEASKVERARLDALAVDMDKNFKIIDGQRIANETKASELFLLETCLKDQKARVEHEIELKQVEVEALRVKYNEQYRNCIEQGKKNDSKTAELNLAFEMLKNRRETLNVDIKKCEAIKKELGI
jgi:chemotaxis protein MotB